MCDLPVCEENIILFVFHLAELDIDQHGDVTTEEAVRLATNAASWSQLYLGVPLRELSLDAVTVTEVLRLHLLSSGGRSGDTSANWR